jgi:hypothetical protein
MRVEHDKVLRGLSLHTVTMTMATFGSDAVQLSCNLHVVPA